MLWYIIFALVVFCLSLGMLSYFKGDFIVSIFISFVILSGLGGLYGYTTDVTKSKYSYRSLNRIIENMEVLEKAKKEIKPSKYWKMYFRNVKEYNDMYDSIEKARKKYNFWYTID